MLSDIEIAQATQPEHIRAIAEKAGVAEEHLELYGNYKAKVDYNQPMNLLLTSIVLGIGVSTASITLGTVTLKGMALATVVAIVLSLLFRIIALLRGEPFAPASRAPEDDESRGGQQS